MNLYVRPNLSHEAEVKIEVGRRGLVVVVVVVVVVGLVVQLPQSQVRGGAGVGGSHPWKPGVTHAYLKGEGSSSASQGERRRRSQWRWPREA